jgi:hypothetical protein
MIIKDTYGDWGIVVGRWKGVNQGIPGISGWSNNARHRVNLVYCYKAI